MANQILLKNAKGVQVQQNPLSQVAEGALLVGDDVSIDREGVISKRTGFNFHGDFTTGKLPGDSIGKDIYEYQDRAVVRLTSNKMAYDTTGSGVWATWTGTFFPVDNTIRSIVGNKNFYFTTLSGVFINDSITGTPVRAGLPRSLDLRLAKTGIGAGFFSPDSQVAYRILFGRVDANQNDKKGSAGFIYERVVNGKSSTLSFTGSVTTITVTHVAHGFTTGDIIDISDVSDVGAENGEHEIIVVDVDTYTYEVAVAPASGTLKDGKSYNVVIEGTLPDDVKAGDYYEVYRTQTTVNVNTIPDDILFKITRKDVESADISNGYITFTDTLDDTFLGERLYQNPENGGLLVANDRPPWCEHIAAYKTHTLYANTELPYFKEIQLQDETKVVADVSTITISDGNNDETYLASTTEDVGLKKFKVETTLTSSENLEATVKSLIHIINRASDLFDAYYTSGLSADQEIGKILIEKKTLHTNQFFITCDDTAATGSGFVPVLPTSGTSISADNQKDLNFVYLSKSGEPEAVPELNTLRIGRADKAIVALKNLPDGVLVYKQDGLFKITGETDGDLGKLFVVDELDPTLNLQAPNSLVLLDNTATGYTTQGVNRATINGSNIVSRDIEPTLYNIAAFQQFNSLTKGISYETAHKYFFVVQEKNTDTYPTVMWVWNYIINGWVRWRRQVNAGLVMSFDDTLYVCHATQPYILKERKTRFANNQDYMDESIPVTITAVGTTDYTNPDGVTSEVSTATVDYSYGSTIPTDGWLLQSGFRNGWVVAVEKLSATSYKLTLGTKISSLATGSATLSIGYESEVHTIPLTADSAGTMKHFTWWNVYMEQDHALINTLGFHADTQEDPAFTQKIVRSRVGGWGTKPWGTFPWGDTGQHTSTPLVVRVDNEHARCRALVLIYKHKQAKEKFSILQMTLQTRPYSGKTLRRQRI